MHAPSANPSSPITIESICYEHRDLLSASIPPNQVIEPAFECEIHIGEIAAVKIVAARESDVVIRPLRIAPDSKNANGLPIDLPPANCDTILRNAKPLSGPCAREGTFRVASEHQHIETLQVFAS